MAKSHPPWRRLSPIALFDGAGSGSGSDEHVAEDQDQDQAGLPTAVGVGVGRRRNAFSVDCPPDDLCE